MSETDPRGYYTCLGLRPWATAADIRAAYHRCAKQWHPDVDPRPEAKARFQAITEAYRILINPAERAIYDRSAGADRSQSGATSLQPRLRAWRTHYQKGRSWRRFRWTITMPQTRHGLRI